MAKIFGKDFFDENFLKLYWWNFWQEFFTCNNIKNNLSKEIVDSTNEINKLDKVLSS